MSSASMETGHTHQGRNFVLWVGLACILIAGIALSWNLTALAALFIVCAFAHAAVYYRASAALTLFVICLLITFTIENIGSLTGFPFGRYISRSMPGCRMSGSFR